VISHDRWFLDRIATHILAFEGESTVDFFDGNVRWIGGWHDAGCTAVGRSRGGWCWQRLKSDPGQRLETDPPWRV